MFKVIFKVMFKVISLLLHLYYRNIIAIIPKGIPDTIIHYYK